MLFSMGNLKERTQNTVLHTVQTVIFRVAGVGLYFIDEPMAALDPFAEAEIYEGFCEMVAKKGAVYISHRLSSCRFCDTIAVFDEGKLVQLGGHEELLEDEGGKYYELWNAQAQYYQ